MDERGRPQIGQQAPAPGDDGERFATSTWPAFDALGAAATATKLVLDELLEPARMGRLVDYHRRDPGQLGLDELLESVAEAAFGDWDAGSEPGLQPPVPAAVAHRSVRTIEMAGKAQSDVAYGFATITRADARYFPMVLMNTVLGQYGLGGRLGDSIRERQGMAYYVFSGFEANVAPGPLVVRAGVHPANVERTIASIDIPACPPCPWPSAARIVAA